MPRIVAKKRGTCSACGGGIAKGEEAFYSTTTGLRHLEKACSEASSARHRLNTRAGRCTCGRWVEAGEGRLEHLGEKRGSAGDWKQLWQVKCRSCS